MKVMIIGDTHLPFDHPNYLKFLKHQKEKENPDKIIHIGDFVDLYALSRFTLDPDVQGQKPEWCEALDRARKYYEAFPEVDWIQGNHDQRAYKKAQTVGLGKLFLKGMKEIYECPAGWNILPSTEIEDVLYVHGVACGGPTGWQMYSQKISKSTVMGHSHSTGGVRYHQNPDGRQVFTLAVGCGVNDDAYAFNYGKESPAKGILGCGFVDDGVYARFVPMNLKDRTYRRIR